MNSRTLVGLLLLLSSSKIVFGAEFLVRFKDNGPAALGAFILKNGGHLSLVSSEGMLYKWEGNLRAGSNVADSSVAFIEPNRKLGLLPNPSFDAVRNLVIRNAISLPKEERLADNPEIKSPGVQSLGADPLLGQAWGMDKIAAPTAWTHLPQGKSIVVAVTDTGVDYNHVDLINNIWRNPGEIAGDGIDNDNNGYIDDVVGWDFVSNDNKPYDMTKSLVEILFQGGNPGHGTHVSGVIGARLNNAEGTAGVAPQVRIMALRFISESGEGSDESAIKAIDYAVKNGANIINASWGGEAGEEDDKALTEAIQRAEAKGVIFVAAAGNGRADQATGQSAGFDNDNDAKPMVPASLNISNILAVAATDSNDALAGFSNWGAKSVKIAAPGVKILSTVPGNKYQDTVIDMGTIKATWDGTSMATPFVVGSLAAIWSAMPTKTWQEVYDTLLKNAANVPGLAGKVATGGRVDLKNIR